VGISGRGGKSESIPEQSERRGVGTSKTQAGKTGREDLYRCEKAHKERIGRTVKFAQTCRNTSKTFQGAQKADNPKRNEMKNGFARGKKKKPKKEKEQMVLLEYREKERKTGHYHKKLKKAWVPHRGEKKSQDKSERPSSRVEGKHTSEEHRRLGFYLRGGGGTKGMS